MGMKSPKQKKLLIAGSIALSIVVVLAIVLPITLTRGDDDDDDIWKGSDVLKEVPLVDGHNDLPWNIYNMENNVLRNFNFDSDLKSHPVWGSSSSSHTDLPRIRQGKLSGQFWVAYVSCSATINKDAVERTMEQIDVIKRLVQKYPYDLKLVTSSAGIWEAFNENKIASLIAVEGGHSIDSRLSVLRLYHELGVRYMTLTHSCNLPWADASPIDDNAIATKINLSEWGKKVILEMNRIGMLVDISHVSHGVMEDVLKYSKAPVMFSHSSSHAVFAHHRNVKDYILEELKKNGGIIMVNFYTGFIGGDNIDNVIEHLNHIKQVIGPDYIGLGGDYDGVSSQPIGLEDTSKYPDLFDKLASDHGWTSDELKKLAGLNLIRVLKEAEDVSLEMKSESPYEENVPYDDLINQADYTDYGCRTNIEKFKEE